MSNQWIAGGSSATPPGPSLSNSADGFTWTDQANIGDGSFVCNCVVYNGSYWLAGGSDDTASQIYKSTSGTSWTSVSQPFGTGGIVEALCWTGSQWVAVGAGDCSIATSPDGVTWTARTSPFDAGGGGGGLGVAYNGSSYVAVGTDGTSSVTIITSPDGVTWSAATDSPFAGGNGFGIAYGDSVWVAVGVNSDNSVSIATSSDGSTWANQGSPFDGTGFGRSVVWTGSQFIAAGNESGSSVFVATSPTGTTWTARSTPLDGESADNVNVVAWNGSQALLGFSVSSTDPTVCDSPTGNTWLESSVPPLAGGAVFGLGWGEISYLTVTGVSPSSGPVGGGASVTVTGDLFSGATSVDFGGTPATSFTVVSSTEITAVTPAGMGTVHVTVTTPSGTSPTTSADEYSYALILNYTVEISPTPPFATPNWQDITPWAQSGNITVGKEHQLDAMQSSTLSLVLNNRLGQFLPWNTDSPFYFSGAGLIPGCPVRIIAYDNADVAYPVFYGYVNSWVPSWTDEVNSTCAMQATDYLANLSNTLLASNSYVTFVNNDGAIAFLRLGDPTGSLTAADSIGSYNGTVAGSLAFSGYGGQFGGSYVDDTGTATFGTATQALGAVALPATLSTALDSGAWSFEAWTQILPGGNSGQNNYIIGTMTSASAGGAVYWFSGYGANTPGHAPQLSALTVTCSGLSGFGLEYQSATEAPTSDIADGNWHHVVATGSAATGGTVSLYLDGVLVVSGTASGGQSSTIYSSTQMALGGFGTYALTSVPLATGTTVTIAGSSYFGLMGEVAFYNVELDAAQVANHYNTWLVGQVVVGTPGIQADNSASRIASILTLLGVPPAFQSIGATTPALGISEVQAVSTDLTSTTALDYIQLVEQTEQGLFFQASDGVLTFYGRHWPILNPSSASVQAIYGDNSANTSYFYLPENFQVSQDDLDLWTSVVTQRLGGVLQFATSASVGAFGSSTREIWRYGVRVYQGAEQLLETTDTEVLSLAQYLLLLSQTPIPRVRSVTLASFVNGGAALPEMFGRQLWDRVMVQRQAQGSQFSQDSLVEQITHEFDYNTWKTTFALVPWFEQGTPWFILDDPIYGQLSTDNQLAF